MRRPIGQNRGVAGKIVVGIDGSKHAAAALRWAAEEATLRCRDARGGARVELRADRRRRPTRARADGVDGEHRGMLDATRDAAERAARRPGARGARRRPRRDASRSSRAAPRTSCSRRPRTPTSSWSGTTGRGNLASALLGSTSAELADSAPCPVVIVRAPTRLTRREESRGPRRELTPREACSGPLVASASRRSALDADGSRSARRVRGEVWFLQDGAACRGRPVGARRSRRLVRSLLAGPTKRERAQRLQDRDPAAARRSGTSASPAASSPSTSARGSRPVETSRPCAPGSASSSARSAPSPACSACACGSRAACRSACSPATTCVGTVREPNDGDRPASASARRSSCSPTSASWPRAASRARMDDETSVGAARLREVARACRATESSTTTSPPPCGARRGPQPILRRPGRRVEIHLGRQVALADRRRPRRARVPHLVGRRRRDAVRLVPRLPQGAHVLVGPVLDVDAVGELLRGRDRVPRVRLGAELPGLARLRPDDGARRAAALRVRHPRDTRRRALGSRVRAVTRLPRCALPRSPSRSPPRRPPRARRHRRRSSRGRSSSRSASATRRCRRVSCGGATSSSREDSRSSSRGCSPAGSERRVGRFVDVRPRGACSPPDAPAWHLALAAIEPSRAGRRAAALSDPYLTTDLAVVLRRGLERPRRSGRAALAAPLRVHAGRARCRSSAARSGPTRAPLVAAGTERLRALVRDRRLRRRRPPGASRQDASWRAQRAPARPCRGADRARRRARGRGRAQDSGLDVAAVDRELRRLRARRHARSPRARVARARPGHAPPAALTVVR